MKRTRTARRLLLAVAVAAAALLLLCGAARADGLSVHFLDIGRNDGILIECDGEYAFVDGGTYEFGGQAVNYMQSLGVRRLKYYIGTHAHKDHVAGASKIILALSPETVLQPHDGVEDLIIRNARSEDERRAAGAAHYVTVAVGQTYAVGRARLTVVGPVNITRYRNYTSLENGNSMICRLTYGEHTFLLTGDAMSRTMNDTEGAIPGALKCDVLKNPHHNGATKTKLVALCAPRYVVFSTSDDHQPTRSVLRDMANLGAAQVITSTHQNGTIIFHTDGRTLSCSVSNGPTDITVNKPELTLYEGKHQSVSARQTPANYRSLLYVSLNEAVATVDGSGRVTGVSPGTATIRALASNGLYADCAVTVLPIGVTLNRDELTVRHGGSSSLRATLLPSGTRGKAVAWTSDNPAVAIVTDKGRVTGVAPGETYVRATLENGSQAACRVTVAPVPVSSVSVSPGSATITIGQTRQLTETVSPKNATDKSVVWSSEDESVVRVDQNGLLTAVGVGRTRVSVETNNGKRRSINVTVKPVYVTSIAMSAGTDTLTAGVAGRDTLQVTAAIQPEEATIKDVEWRSSNTRVATVDGNGRVTAVGVGRVSIYALAQDGSRRRGAFRLNVAANQFVRRSAVVEPGRLAVSAKQLSYERDYLKVVLFYANGTEERVPVPGGGVLTLIMPDGARLPVMPMETGQGTLRRNGVTTVTLRLPLAAYPRLAGLDLASCDATVTH